MYLNIKSFYIFFVSCLSKYISLTKLTKQHCNNKQHRLKFGPIFATKITCSRVIALYDYHYHNKVKHRYCVVLEFLELVHETKFCKQ